MREEEQLRRTDPAAYIKMIHRKQTMPANGPTMTAAGPAINHEQLLRQGPGLETTAPYPSTVATTLPRMNESEVYIRASIPSNSYMPPPNIARTVQTSVSAATFTDPRAVSATSPIRVTPSARRVSMPIGQAIPKPSVEPVLGPNTRVEQCSFSESLEEVGPPAIRTPSSSVRAESEPVNERLSEEVRSKRETVRQQSKSTVEAAIQRQVELGKIVVTSVPDIAEILAHSMERHAYGNAESELQYNRILNNSLAKFAREEQGSKVLVDKAEEKRMAKSTKGRRSAAPSQPPPSPGVSNSGQLPLAQAASNRSTTPATSKDGETVGSLVHSPLSKPPDLAAFPALAGLMQKEANRKTG